MARRRDVHVIRRRVQKSGPALHRRTAGSAGLKTRRYGRWVVVQHGRTLSRHRTQATAVRVATRAAKRQHVDLVTHGRDGRIRSKDSYGFEGPTLDTEH